MINDVMAIIKSGLINQMPIEIGIAKIAAVKAESCLGERFLVFSIEAIYIFATELGVQISNLYPTPFTVVMQSMPNFCLTFLGLPLVNPPLIR